MSRCGGKPLASDRDPRRALRGSWKPHPGLDGGVEPLSPARTAAGSFVSDCGPGSQSCLELGHQELYMYYLAQTIEGGRRDVI
jgi:hypothetical protein